LSSVGPRVSSGGGVSGGRSFSGGSTQAVAHNSAGGSYRGSYQAASFSHPAPGLGHGYYGGRYYGYNTYGFRGWYNPYFGYGAFAGAFWGGVVIGGIFNPFWWPYYAIPTQPGYYDSYPDYYTYQQDPEYVIAVPPAEATTAYQQQEPYQQQGAAPPVNMPPDQCYGPKVDANGNVIKDNGNMVPDFSKPVPCPPQQ
jgi:hypothetical protein